MARHVVVARVIGTTSPPAASAGHEVLRVPPTPATPLPAPVRHEAMTSRPWGPDPLTRGAEVIYNCVNPPYHRWVCA